MFFAPSKSRYRPKIWKKVYQRPVTISKSRSRFKTLVRGPPASSKTPNQDLKEMDVLCTFKIKIVKIWNIGVDVFI